SVSDIICYAIIHESCFNIRRDDTHDLFSVVICEFDKRWSLFSTFIYATGHAVTYPTWKYHVDGKTIWYYSERNAHRMPDYHRLDLSLTWEGRKSGRLDRKSTRLNS